MIGGLRFKICGLRRPEDVEAAIAAKADFLGFILYPKSPRFLPLADYETLRGKFPVSPPHIAVMVEPTPEEIRLAQSAGFRFFQIHFGLEIARERIYEWLALIGKDRLWLAPRLPDGAVLPVELIGLTDTILLDAFDSTRFGGSGKTGNWDAFVRYRQSFPDKQWILAGGLSPGNVAEAVQATGTDFVDLNSGVESAPGVKSAEKIKRLAANLRARVGKV